MNGEDLGLTQKAFADEDAFQCGYCTPGQVVAAEGLLREPASNARRDPPRDERKPVPLRDVRPHLPPRGREGRRTESGGEEVSRG